MPSKFRSGVDALFGGFMLSEFAVIEGDDYIFVVAVI